MESERVIGIHQPNFFPWLGLFHRIAHADLFVYFDHVCMMPRGSWVSRVKILNQKEPDWLSIPVASWKEETFPALNEVRITADDSFKSKHLRTIKRNYQHHPFFDPVFPLIEHYYDSEEPLLAKRNHLFIEAVCQALHLSTPRRFSSELGCQSAGTDLIAEVVQKVGGTTFLCGGGTGGFLEPEKFPQVGLKLVYQNFQHPIYPQQGRELFVPGLSIIDVLMNCGFEMTSQLVKT